MDTIFILWVAKYGGQIKYYSKGNKESTQKIQTIPEFFPSKETERVGSSCDGADQIHLAAPPSCQFLDFFGKSLDFSQISFILYLQTLPSIIFLYTPVPSAHRLVDKFSLKLVVLGLINSLTPMVACLQPLFHQLQNIVVSWPILAASAS